MAAKIKVNWQEDRSRYDFAVVGESSPLELHVTLLWKDRPPDKDGCFYDVSKEKTEIEIVGLLPYTPTVNADSARILASMLNQAAAEIAFWEAEGEVEQ